MRINHFVVSLLLLALPFSVFPGCDSGGSDAGGGLVGFSTGQPQTGPVPSDGTSPDAPKVTAVVATNPQVKSGEPLKIGVSFTDLQGDIANVNFGVLGQTSHRSLPASRVGIQTSGTLFLDLKPNAWAPGQYTLVVSMTDTAGHISASTTLPFTILDPKGNVPPQSDAAVIGVDAPIMNKDTAPLLPDAQVDVMQDTSGIVVDLAQEGIAADGGADTGMPDSAIIDTGVTGDAPCATSSDGVVHSTATGGLWHAPATWVCGVVPTATDDVQINGEVQVNFSAAKSTATCRHLTVATKGVLRGAAYEASKILITGHFINLGEVRNGPNYASYDTATLEVHVGGNFTQNNSYGGVVTHFVGAQAQTLIYAEGKDLGGTFIDDDPKTPIKAGSAISATATSLTLGSTTLGRGTLDMGAFALTLKAGDFKVLNGLLIANQIIGVLGATLSADQIQVGSTSLALEGDVCTASTTITGSVTVAALSVLYNQSNVDAVVVVTGNLENNGTVRKGPGYAAYGEGTLTMHLAGNLAQNGIYTPTATQLNGSAAQTISLLVGKTLVGSFTDTTPTSPIVAGSDLTIGGAEFILSKDATSPASVLKMGTFKLIHPSGNLKIATGTLEANDLTGGSSGETVFSISAIVPPSGTLSITNHFPTGSMTVTGNLTVQPGAKVYNQVHVEARLTVTGSVSNLGIMGSGPGYASYDSGMLFLNGEKLPGWQ